MPAKEVQKSWSVAGSAIIQELIRRAQFVAYSAKGKRSEEITFKNRRRKGDTYWSSLEPAFFQASMKETTRSTSFITYILPISDVASFGLSRDQIPLLERL